MRIIVKLFGLLPVFVIDGTAIDGMWEYSEEQSTDIEAGSAHNFERDYYPLSPTAHHEWEWEDKKKGFGFR